MRWPLFGGKRRTRRGQSAPSRQSVAVETRPALEALEQRVLLSAVTYGNLPSLNLQAYTSDATYDFNLRQPPHTTNSNTVTGQVYHDADGDGLWDPNEHALEAVTVYADLNGDGQAGDGEARAKTMVTGGFVLGDLPAGDYDVRVVIPRRYQASVANTDIATVSIDSDKGVGGLSFGLSRTGFDLGLTLSEVSMQTKFQTGTRVKVPVILTNRGDTVMPAGDTRLVVWVSEDREVDKKKDVRLTVTPFTEELGVGESVKVELDVNLPSALADFKSYLIVDAVGRDLRRDKNDGDNMAVSINKRVFVASSRPTVLPPAAVDAAASDWNNSTPYGGYRPGYGYSGIRTNGPGPAWDAHWRHGTSPSYSTYQARPRFSDLTIEGGRLAQGIPTRITAHEVSDPKRLEIERVMFFYDADGDWVLDDLLGVDEDGSDGYSILAELPSIQALHADARVVAIAGNTNHIYGAISVEAAPSMAVEIRAGKALVFRDAEGSLVTVQLTGRGSAQLLMEGTGVQAIHFGDRTEVAGEAALGDIHLSGTNGRSKLIIHVSSEKKTVMTGMVTGSSGLGLLSAAGVEIMGGIRMTEKGVIRNIKAARVRGIVMPGEQCRKGVSISTTKLSGTIELGSPLLSLDTVNMKNVRLAAPRAERIWVARNAQASSIILTDPDADVGLALLHIGDQMRNVRVLAAAPIDTIRAQLMIQSGVQVGGDAWLSAPASSASQEVRRGYIKQLIVDGGVFADSYASAWRIGSVSLDSARRASSTAIYGLIYHRLGRYQGPGNVDRRVI